MQYGNGKANNEEKAEICKKILRKNRFFASTTKSTLEVQDCPSGFAYDINYKGCFSENETHIQKLLKTYFYSIFSD